MPKARLAVMGVLLLTTACSHTPSPETSARSLPEPTKINAIGFNHWHCAGQTPLQWRYVDERAEQIDMRIGGDDIMHRLSKRPAGLHSTYSDGLLAFELRGQTGRLYRVPSGKHVDYDCQAQ